MSAKQSLAQAQLAIESARALFREGILLECHAYLALALRSLLDAWAPSDSTPSDTPSSTPSESTPSSTPSDSATTLRERREQALLALERSKYPHMVRLSAAYRAVLDEAPGAAHSAAALGERDFDWIWPEVDRLNRFTLRQLAPVETRKRFRIRLALVLVPILLVVAMIISLQRVRPKVVASATYGEPFLAEQAVDSLEATEWLLPGGVPGWIELTFGSPRNLRSVTLVNCHNSVFGDRGAGKVRVTAFAKHEIVASAEGKFDAISQQRSALDLPLEGKDVTAVRVEILSVLGLGGGMAEVELH